MKILLLPSFAGLVLLGCCFTLQAQTALPYIIASSGSSGVAPNGSTVSFTVGETIITTVGSNPQFTQGFQQPNTTGNPLPVQWLDFSGTAKERYNLLQWRTAQEKNNDYFNVERSSDGVNFRTIGKVYSKAAGGNSSKELAYTFTDNTMSSGISYYRLQQTDRDKQYSYSRIVSLDNNSAGQSFTLSPNPTKGKVFLTVNQLSDQAIVQLNDINGREIRTIRPTSLITEIDLSGLTTGTYLVRYTEGSKTASVKVVKD